jgi:hypothetical protein
MELSLVTMFRAEFGLFRIFITISVPFNVYAVYLISFRGRISKLNLMTRALSPMIRTRDAIIVTINPTLITNTPMIRTLDPMIRTLTPMIITIIKLVDSNWLWGVIRLS